MGLIELVDDEALNEIHQVHGIGCELERMSPARNLFLMLLALTCDLAPDLGSHSHVDASLERVCDRVAHGNLEKLRVLVSTILRDGV